MGTRKIKYKGKKQYTSRKEGIIILCFDQDNEPVFMNVKTKAYKCEIENKLISEIKDMFDLPKKQITISQMSPEEQEFFNLTEGKLPSVALRYDTESVKYQKVKEELDTCIVFARIATHFQMDEKIEVDGKEITHWENFGLKSKDWMGLVKYLSDENKLGLSLGEINVITKQIESIKLGVKTLGEELIDGQINIDEIQSEVDEFEETLDVKKEDDGDGEKK